MSKESTLGRYSPGVPPTNAEELPLFLQGNLGSIASMVNSPMKNFAPLNKAPEKPREGDIAFANGDSWNPGDGRGLYMYAGEEWVLVAGAGGGGGSSFPIGGIIMWTGSYVPEDWALCDGTDAPNGSPTPDLQDRFIKGAGSVSVGTTGGSTNTGSTSLSPAQMPSHNHSGPDHTHGGPSHTHTQMGTFGSTSDGTHGHGNAVLTIATALVRGETIFPQNDYFPHTPSAIPQSGAHTHSTTISGQTGHTAGTTGGGGTGSTGSTGSGNSHNHSLDPVFYAIAFIMKYA